MSGEIQCCLCKLSADSVGYLARKCFRSGCPAKASERAEAIREGETRRLLARKGEARPAPDGEPDDAPADRRPPRVLP